MGQDGEPVHGSSAPVHSHLCIPSSVASMTHPTPRSCVAVYRHLWSNGPKECLEFADYGFEQHFGKAIPSYPPREVLHDYIIGRVEKSGVKPWVQLNTCVKHVSFDAATNKFTVRTVNSAAEDGAVERSEEFDYVFCCSGHFSTPNVPEFAGMETFSGRVMHAHDFRRWGLPVAHARSSWALFTQRVVAPTLTPVSVSTASAHPRCAALHAALAAPKSFTGRTSSSLAHPTLPRTSRPNATSMGPSR